MIPVDVVLIGRNEGARLVAALGSVMGQARQVVYVDSGSTDASVAEARKAGAKVVELDMSIPFTAARARNEGFAALHDPQLVQFIDGDCMLVDGFLDAARAHLLAHDHLGMVTGWRSEIHRDASVYNQLADFEWRRPAGEIQACGGDMMVRASVFREVGGFDPTVIAAEDDEFCVRLRKAGWRLDRIPNEMTRHDMDMHRFAAWWKRAVRGGHGYAQVGHMHPPYFRTEQRRILVYGLGLPLLLIAGLLWWPLAGMALLLYALNYIRTARGLERMGLSARESRRHSALITLSKIPNLIGMATYHLRRLRNDQMKIIEYK
ncbi:glycosyltransferase [Salipiger sp. 1_MG-2023]|uniref:glycosyltransferase n=1 Tax=Salipiger sp. 1_MG-2023 TaxID=3062665 RepID=UPI0026E1A49C|nr:glycosyltransferase family 2 protein [Salipiger sp. 1_MG-2023]MDO6586299.1 glycosyltransferase [Salipiger sp. 1_MG-2023]